MVRLIDADKVIAILRREAKEWATASAAEKWRDVAIRLQGISMGYTAAAEDIEKMVKEQAEGNVPTDGSE